MRWILLVLVLALFACGDESGSPQPAASGNVVVPCPSGSPVDTIEVPANAVDQDLFIAEQCGAREAARPTAQAAPLAGGVEAQQAVRQAEEYLNYTAFSRSGLIEQLEFEGYSAAIAAEAVDSLGVDWAAQAVAMGRNYLDYSSFSRQGLIDQLVFEGFSNGQARRAADIVFG